MVNSELPNDMILTTPILFMSQSISKFQTPPAHEEVGITTTSGDTKRENYMLDMTGKTDRPVSRLQDSVITGPQSGEK